jgi:hypothetical protein
MMKGEVNMPRKILISSDEPKPMRPALHPEARENQMIALAVDLAEKQLRDGTASSQVITHFLKLATSKEKLEQEILAEQKKLLVAKTDSYKSSARVEALYADALEAMRTYTGTGDKSNDEEPE